MRLRFSLVRPEVGGPPVDVVVTAPAGTPLGAVSGPLARVLERAGGLLYAGSRLLGDDLTLGRPPLLDGAVLGVDGPAVPDPPPGLLELRVVGGPDAGVRHRLATGRVVLGRGAGAPVRLADPQVSRRHAALLVEPDGVQVADLGSANGTYLDGRSVGSTPVPVTPGALLRLGESTLQVVATEAAPAAVAPDGAGGLVLNPGPRPGLAGELAPQPRSVTLPRAPAPSGPTRLPWAMLGTPLLLGGGFAALSGSRTSLLIAGLTPLALAGGAAAERWTARRRFRRQTTAHLREYAAASDLLATELQAAARRRHRVAPDAAALLAAAEGRQVGLWARRPADPDWLRLRLGCADLPAAPEVTVTGPEEVPRLWLPWVPLTLALAEVGVLGVAGPREAVLRLARSLVGQLAALHGPGELRLAVLGPAAAAGDWAWARWLPHLGDATDDLAVAWAPDQARDLLAELARGLDAGRPGGHLGPGPPTRPVTVVIVDGPAQLRALPGFTPLLRAGPAAGVYAVCLAAQLADLPPEAQATAVVTGEVATRLQVSLATSADRTVGEATPASTTVVADGVSLAWAEALARALAPLREATPPPGRLPRAVRLPALLGPGDGSAAAVTPEHLLAWWSRDGDGLPATVGVDVDGPVTLDLARDGPHALVAGTTGSGKSELLRTLVAALAAAHPPEQLAFLLVDYKGGTAFAECARLPHTVGLLTDLDGRLTARALASLEAELRRRERLLREAECPDLAAYLTRWPADGSESGPPLGRLVVVVDEFAALAAELPEFLRGLVDVAARGRALGLHLVLATQRPGGVVSPDIRANTALRIALRMTDEAESLDVVGTGQAAALSPRVPGRAVLRAGPDRPRLFQAAIVGRPAAADDGPVTVRRRTWPGASSGQPGRDAATGEACPVDPVTTDPPPTDLARLVAAAEEAARRRGRPPPRRPWVPPLPSVVTLDELGGADPDLVPLGRTDLPAEQRHGVFGLRLGRDANLLVAGAPRSGRSTLLSALVAATAPGPGVANTHVYAVEGSAPALGALGAFPHVGAVVEPGDGERARRLLARLDEEVRRRRALLADGGHASAAEQRAAGPAGAAWPWLLLLVYGWESFLAAHDAPGDPSVDTLLRLGTEGLAAGLHLVLTGGRGLLTGPPAGLAGPRLLLRLVDPLDYPLAGVRVDALPPEPGRGVLAPEGTEVQVALPAAQPSGQAQLAALAARAAQATAYVGRDGPGPLPRGPLRVAALPRRVAYSVAAAAAGPRPPGWALLGLGGDDAGPIGVDLSVDGPALLVTGRPGSGRTSTLLTLAAWYAGRGVPVVAVAPTRSPLRRPGVSPVIGPPMAPAPGPPGDGPAVVLDPTAASALAAALRAPRPAGRPVVLLADDVTALLDTPVEPLLVEVCRGDGPDGAVLVAAGGLDELAAAYRGLPAELRRGRCALVLGPTGPLDGEPWGVRLAPAGPPLPGRGVLVRHGRQQPVQVADPPVRVAYPPGAEP